MKRGRRWKRGIVSGATRRGYSIRRQTGPVADHCGPQSPTMALFNHMQLAMPIRHFKKNAWQSAHLER